MGNSLSSNCVELKKRNDILVERDITRDKNYKEAYSTLKKEKEITEAHKSQIKKLEDELDVIRESSVILGNEKNEVIAREKEAVKRANEAIEQAKSIEGRAAYLEQELATLKANPSIEMRQMVRIQGLQTHSS